MKRLIIAILLFVIGCIIIGVIKQEYLIHKLLSQLSFNDSEVILFSRFCKNLPTLKYSYSTTLSFFFNFTFIA